MVLDETRWSGEGTFTAALLDFLKTVPEIEFVRVEDAPASRTDVNYSFMANEVYVRFHRPSWRERGWFARQSTPAMTLAALAERLSAIEGVGPPDYADDAMLQFLKAERIVPPYQTRGYKVVELVRIYGIPD